MVRASPRRPAVRRPRARRLLLARAARQPRRRARPARAPCARARSALQRLPVVVHLLAAEQPLLAVPWKEDHDVELDALPRRRPPEPVALVSPRDMSLLADTLRPDDDVR